LILSLLNITICLGLVNVLICYVLLQRVLTPVFFYWLAWVIGIGSAMLCEYWGLLPPVTDFGSSIILKSHIGCFFGSIIASLLYVLMTGGIIKRKKSIPVWVSRLNQSNAQRYLWKVTLFIGALSIFHFLYRVSLLGSVELPYVATTFMSNIRYSFLFTDIGYTRYFNLLMSFVFVASTLLAVMIANNKIANKRAIISIFILAVIIHSMASGGRHFILTAIFYFIVGFALIYNEIQKNTISKVLLQFKALFKYLIVVVLVFMVIGNLRSGRDITSFEGEVVNISKEYATAASVPAWVPSAVIEYAGVSIAASGPMSENISENDTYGKFTFAFIYKWLAKFGVLSSEMASIDESEFNRTEIRKTDFRIGWTQGTALPYLIADFGIENLILSMGILVFFLQFIFLVFLRKKLVGLFIAVHCCYASFFLTQTIVTINGQFSIAVMLLLYAQKNIIFRQAAKTTNNKQQTTGKLSSTIRQHL
jgi:oligosaccharide repeat unit polymerase